MPTRQMAAGEYAGTPTRAELRRYGVAAAINAGHDPRAVREWSMGDLLHLAVYRLGQQDRQPL
jgi:hypothetical protein